MYLLYHEWVHICTVIQYHDRVCIKQKKGGDRKEMIDTRYPSTFDRILGAALKEKAIHRSTTPISAELEEEEDPEPLPPPLLLRPPLLLLLPSFSSDLLRRKAVPDRGQATQDGQSNVRAVQSHNREGK